MPAYLIWLAVMVPTFLIAFILARLLRDAGYEFAASMMPIMIFLIVCWPGVAFFGRLYFFPRVVRELRSMGYEVCATCGYLLMQLSDDSDCCPECGAKRQPLGASQESIANAYQNLLV